MNLNVIGLVGVLLLAKKKLLIPSIKEILDKLRIETGFWIKEDLYQEILNQAGE